MFVWRASPSSQRKLSSQLLLKPDLPQDKLIKINLVVRGNLDATKKQAGRQVPLPPAGGAEKVQFLTPPGPCLPSQTVSQSRGIMWAHFCITERKRVTHKNVPTSPQAASSP